ncbi:hypothetical protein D9M71_532800 [compost metagenome]
MAFCLTTGGIHVCPFEKLRARGGVHEPVRSAVEQRGDLLQMGAGPRVALCLPDVPFRHRPGRPGVAGAVAQAEVAQGRQTDAVCDGHRRGVVGGVSDFLSAGPGP